VTDDIFELIVEQARVHGVEHAPHPWHPEPGDEVPVVVHGEGRHAIAGPHARILERLR